MTKIREVLISGSSVAGPALAYWLHRHGFRPVVVERAPARRPGGYKVDLRGAAVTVATRMGLLPELRRMETNMQSMSFVNKEGKRLATVSAALFLGRHGDDDLEVMRGDLSRLLYENTQVEYLFGDSNAGLKQSDDEVRVEFENAGPRRFDLVVGADGLHSNVRSLAFGDESKFVRHLGYGVSIFTVPNHLGLDRSELVYSLPGRTVNVYSTRQDADAKALFLWSAPELRYDRRDVTAQKRLLRDTFAGAGWEVDRLLEAIDGAEDFYFDSVSQVELATWSAGRVTVVGDAAYSPSLASGQGSSLALVGGYVLAGELKRAGGDHRTALRRYEELMRPFAGRNLKLGRDNIRRMVAKSNFQSWSGVQFMRLLPRLPGRNALIAKVTRPIHDAANAIALEDY